LNTESNKPSVYDTMAGILAHMNGPQEKKNIAGHLAAIRNSIGKGYENTAEVWPIIFPLMPAEYLGNGAMTYEEKALLVTLQLYAIGQQGSNKTQGDRSRNFGSSLRNIRGIESAALDRRFNTMLTATTFEEFAYHLRQIFKLAKSKNTFSVNFPALAEDLFWYQKDKDKMVCLRWAREYYRPSLKKDTVSSDE
jgi:CRISPR system Cascade subunit CasB